MLSLAGGGVRVARGSYCDGYLRGVAECAAWSAIGLLRTYLSFAKDMMTRCTPSTTLAVLAKSILSNVSLPV